MHEAKPILIFFGVVLAGVSLGSRELSSVYVQHLPREYFSAVILETKPLTFNRETGLPESAVASARSDPEFLAAEIQSIKRPDILESVIERLDLVTKLSPPGMTMPMQWVTEVLTRNIVVQEKKNTSLIEIGAYHADKQLAAEIANTVAVIYRDKRNEEKREEIDLALAEMKDELKAKREEMEHLFQEASRIRMKDNILDVEPDAANAMISFAGGCGGLEVLFVEKRALVDQLRNQLARIEQLKPEELMEALRMLNISARLPNEQIESIKRALKTKLGIEETTLKIFEEKMNSIRKRQVDDETRLARYREKKSAYLMAKRLMEELQQRWDRAGIALAKFAHSSSQVPVKIWQRAEPALIPARPDAARLLRWANAIGGSLAAVGVLLILIGVFVPSRVFTRPEDHG